MTLLEKVEQIQRVDALIRRRGTGSPAELAHKLNVSERYVFKLIKMMKELGAPVYFCKNRNSYCYEQEVQFAFGFVTPK